VILSEFVIILAMSRQPNCGSKAKVQVKVFRGKAFPRACIVGRIAFLLCTASVPEYPGTV
jgi:hypothetical protein